MDVQWIWKAWNSSRSIILEMRQLRLVFVMMRGIKPRLLLLSPVLFLLYHDQQLVLVYDCTRGLHNYYFISLYCLCS